MTVTLPAQDMLETDYLVIGAGAMAIGFVDALLDETDATFLMVDRRDHPGGHWNDAYPFVRLHQPSAYYGVCSRELGTNLKETGGPNKGTYELATRDQILDYYDQVMRRRLLASGRVQWLPLHDVTVSEDGTCRIRSLLTGTEFGVTIRRKLVNATHAQTEIPSTHPPRYTVAPGVNLVTPNQLASIRRTHSHYAVVGSGKTGMDTCMWLLEKGVDPDRIRWIMPRDPWVLDRQLTQPFVENFETTVGFLVGQLQCIVDAKSIPHLFELLESRGSLMRLDPKVQPEAYHCAVLSKGELHELRRIKDIVRLGRVTGLEKGSILLEKGSVESRPDTLYIDCSASALHPSPNVPVFAGSTINLLMVRTCQPAFSSAVIGFVEGKFKDDDTKNTLCQPVKVPREPLDWARMWLQTFGNLKAWHSTPEMVEWLSRCRLDLVTAAARGMEPGDPRRMQMAGAMAVKAAEAAPRLIALLQEYKLHGANGVAKA